jgi:hypothetical protein
MDNLRDPEINDMDMIQLAQYTLRWILFWIFFPYFEKIKGGFWDQLAVCVSFGLYVYP